MNVDELLSGAKDAMTARTVFAEPIERDGVLIIPAAKLRRRRRRRRQCRERRGRVWSVGETRGCVCHSRWQGELGAGDRCQPDCAWRPDRGRRGTPRPALDLQEARLIHV